MGRHVLVLCEGPVTTAIESIRRRWDPVMAERMPAHLTVAHPEEVDDLDLLVECLTAEADTSRAFPLDVSGVINEEGGVFLHVHDRTDALARLRGRLLVPPFASVGLRSHVTICHPRTSPHGREAVEQLRTSAPSGSIMVRELCLTETTDGVKRIVDRFPLAPPHEQVVAGALRRDRRLLLAHRVATRRAHPNVWDLPGGHVDDGELGAEALRRELREEIGVDVGDLTPKPDAVVFLHDGDLAIWRIDEWDGEPTNTAPEEHDELRWCAPADWADLDLADGVTTKLLGELLAR